MNPADFGMFWINQYAQAERMMMDDNTSYYAQPSIGMSVMDDISHQTNNSLDMNSIGLISEFTAATAPGPIAITPDLFGGLPRATTATHLAQRPQPLPTHSHHGFASEHQQTILDHYGALINGNRSRISVGTSNMCDEQIEANIEHVQHFDIGVGSDSASIHQQYDDDIEYNDDMIDACTGDDNSMDTADQYEDDDGDDDENDGNGGTSCDISDTTNGNHLTNYQSIDAVALHARSSNVGRLTHKKKTKSTQTNRKIKPVKRPGLVLKTPIAYQPCLDPSVIPIQRDGMAVCERCGAIGVKHSFYTKERRFCSMACARGDFLMMQTISETNNTNNSSSDLITDATSEKIQKNSMIKIDKGDVNSGTMTTTMTTSNNAINMDIEDQLNATQIQKQNYRFKLSSNVVSRNNSNSNDDDFGTYNSLNINSQSGDVLYQDLVPEDDLPQIPKGNRLPSPCPQDEKIITVRRKPNEFFNSYDWSNTLADPNFFAAPVSCFAHAPGYDMWTNIGIGMKVEVENTDCDIQGLQQVLMPHSFWVATVLRLCGYKAQLRYEGFDNDNSHDFWVNLCSSEVHPVGWCATRGKPLIPPRTIENKYDDWKELLVKRLSGARTLPTTFYNKINDSLKSRFRCGLQLEVVNKNRISQMRLATVHKIIGKRLLVRYFDAPEDIGFWVHEDSPLIHPVGWSINVGHDLAAPPEYLERMYAGQEQALEEHDDDATMNLFKMNFTFEEYYLDGKISGFMAGMKLEAVDPLNLSSICVATVMEVLKFGYLMIRIDSYDPDVTGADLFCYHEKSACILPPGFCKNNNIALTPPKGYDSKSFSWPQYLADSRCIPANEKLFHRETTDNGFAPGMKIECADLMDPRLVCVATVAKTVGRLLKVHFDGWEEEYDQWLDAQSPDMYPVGWCILVGHKLEGPPLTPRPLATQKTSPKLVKRGRGKYKKKGDVKGKQRATTPTGLHTRNTTVKKEKEIFEQQKHNEIAENLNGNRVKRSLSTIPNEMLENVNDTIENDDNDDDEFSHDGYSHSIASMQSLSPTPEPRNVTPTQQQMTRPSSKTSTISMSSTSSPPPERKATSYINNSTASSGKLIPRLVDSSVNNSSMSQNANNLKNSVTPSQQQQQHQNTDQTNDLSPDTWNIYDVGQFLRVNDCTAHCETFSRYKIDGKRLLKLTKDEIVEMLSMKVGPALKIYDLIQQLKVKLKPSRLSNKSNISKSLP